MYSLQLHNILYSVLRNLKGRLAAVVSAPLHSGRAWGWVLFCLTLTSCIEPPLKLPGEEVMVEMPIVVTDIEVVWNVDVDWRHDWYYGWDDFDTELWGPIEYPTPRSYEVRRYLLGQEPGLPHTSVDPPFTIYGTRFKRAYEFGYYDLLLWSNIETADHTQVVYIDESDLNEVRGTTTVTRAMKISRDDANLHALYNQPEIYYSAFPRDIYISRFFEDYDYFDEQENVWVKHVNCTLEPLVYIYLVQVIIHNNADGRIKSSNGDCAITAMAASTSVNTGHTYNDPCMVYFNTRMKRRIDVRGENTDIIGGKLTTYGLCDMEGYGKDNRAQYNGSRTDLPNYLVLEFNMKNGSTQSVRFDVTEQMRQQCHGGVITVEIDAKDIPDPEDESGGGSLFQPVVEDYDELFYDIIM